MYFFPFYCGVFLCFLGIFYPQLIHFLDSSVKKGQQIIDKADKICYNLVTTFSKECIYVRSKA